MRLAYTVAGDTAEGTLTIADGTRYPAFGVRFDSAAVNVIAPTLPPIGYDSRPVVMIRLDDAFTTDRDFRDRALTLGPPPQVVLIERCGFRLRVIEEIIRREAIRIAEFSETTRALLLLRR